MLNGPALLRVLLVVIAAVVLTGLVQRYWLFDSGQPEPAAMVERPATPSAQVRRAQARAADPVPVRSPAPPATVAQPAPPPPPAPAMSEPEPVPAAPIETRNATLAPQPPPGRTLPRAPVPAPPAEARPQSAEQEIAAAEAADPRAVDLVDINTGTLAALNGLKGGGAIGRAIIQRRPYASTDQLLSKRVLSRAIYQRIKDQITVR